MGSLSNNDGDVNETGKKESVYICKTATLLHVHYTFFFISQPSLQVYYLKLPNFTLPLDGVGRTQHKKSFSFLNSVTVLSDLTADNFAKSLQIKLN